MTREKVSRIVAAVAATGFILSAALLASSYESVADSARQSPPDVASLLPALWLSLTVAMTIFGAIVAFASRSQTDVRLMLFLAASFPAITGAFFLRFLGLGTPAIILLTVAGLTLVAGILRPRPTRAAA
jgi:tryptophan-rich sensory protein